MAGIHILRKAFPNISQFFLDLLRQFCECVAQKTGIEFVKPRNTSQEDSEYG